MRVLSLFDGISCGRVALERAGIPVEKYVAYEIDDNATKITMNNYPDTEQRGDVCEADFTEFRGFDLLIGGSPCTHWSIAREKATRETKCEGIGWELFSQYLRALEEARPKYFLYENNVGIPEPIKNKITELLGVEPVKINSALVSAQNRNRYYWTNIPNVTVPEDRGILLKDVLEDVPLRPLKPFMFNYYGEKRRVDKALPLSRDKSGTLTTSTTHTYYVNDTRDKMRTLTVTEYEKLQTLPLGYTEGVSNTARYKAVGNGWTVEVIAHIFKGLKD